MSRSQVRLREPKRWTISPAGATSSERQHKDSRRQKIVLHNSWVRRAIVADAGPSAAERTAIILFVHHWHQRACPAEDALARPPHSTSRGKSSVPDELKIVVCRALQL